MRNSPPDPEYRFFKTQASCSADLFGHEVSHAYPSTYVGNPPRAWRGRSCQPERGFRAHIEATQGFRLDSSGATLEIDAETSDRGSRERIAELGAIQL